MEKCAFCEANSSTLMLNIYNSILELKGAKMNNTTALMSAFLRYYHTQHNSYKIYDDHYAKMILRNEEILSISKHLADGIAYFNPHFEGDEPLEWIINHQLAPSVLARAAFNEWHLHNELKLGLKQYLILASGYDTSAYKLNNKIKAFELDKSDIIEDKKARIQNAHIDVKNVEFVGVDFNDDFISPLLESGFDKRQKTFCSMLGISYYLQKEKLIKTIQSLADNMPKGSVIVLDYPNENETRKEIINQELAKAANEAMQSKYTLAEIEQIAQESNMLIYENLGATEINQQYFKDYNTQNPAHIIYAPSGVSYCLMVKNPL